MEKTAIILAGGSGSRMKSSIPKQYIEYNGKPILYYTIKAFEESIVDKIVLVIRKGDYEKCYNDIVKKYNFNKVKSIVYGGAQRYDSVKAGLDAIDDTNGIVFIHDGARPCVTQEIINRCYENVLKYRACIAAVPVKDTIKVIDEKGFAINTPDRSTLWQVQTPQVFEVSLIKKAYDNMLSTQCNANITDDAMIVENYTDIKVKVVSGSYTNIKITTPEDLNVLSAIMHC